MSPGVVTSSPAPSPDAVTSPLPAFNVTFAVRGTVIARFTFPFELFAD